MRCRDFTAEIRLQGSELKLEEWQTEVIGSRTTCYIPSEVGKNFNVVLQDHCRQRAFDASLYLDGQTVHRGACLPGQPSIVEGLRNGPNTLQCFKFSELTLLDSDNAPINCPNLDHIGVITIELRRIQVCRRTLQSQSSISSFTELGPVHERSKKAGAHCVSLGGCKRTKAAETYIVRHLSGEDPYITFSFRYRPRDLLQAQGFLSTASSQNVRGHTKHELSEDLDRQDRPGKRLKYSHSQGPISMNQDSGADPKLPLRAQLGDSDVIDLTEGELKREQSPIRATAVHGAFIDLTADDC